MFGGLLYRRHGSLPVFEILIEKAFRGSFFSGRTMRNARIQRKKGAKCGNVLKTIACR